MATSSSSSSSSSSLVLVSNPFGFCYDTHTWMTDSTPAPTTQEMPVSFVVCVDPGNYPTDVLGQWLQRIIDTDMREGDTITVVFVERPGRVCVWGDAFMIPKIDGLSADLLLRDHTNNNNNNDDSLHPLEQALHTLDWCATGVTTHYCKTNPVPFSTTVLVATTNSAAAVELDSNDTIYEKLRNPGFPFASIMMCVFAIDGVTTFPRPVVSACRHIRHCNYMCIVPPLEMPTLRLLFRHVRTLCRETGAVLATETRRCGTHATASHSIQLHYATIHDGTRTHMGNGLRPGVYMVIPASGSGAKERVYRGLLRAFPEQEIHILPPSEAGGGVHAFCFWSSTGEEATAFRSFAAHDIVWMGRMTPELKVHPNRGEPMHDTHKWSVVSLHRMTDNDITAIETALRGVVKDVVVRTSEGNTVLDRMALIQRTSPTSVIVYVRVGRTGDHDVPMALAQLEFVFSVSCLSWVQHFSMDAIFARSGQPVLPLDVAQPDMGNSPTNSARVIRGPTFTFTGRGVTVGIVDTGLDPRHPYFLGTKLVPEQRTPQPQPDTGHEHIRAIIPYIDIQPEFRETDHGTHVAGIVKNVAPDARLVTEDISCNTVGGCECVTTLDPDCVCRYYPYGRCPNSPGNMHPPADIRQSFDRLVQNGANIINLSLGPAYIPGTHHQIPYTLHSRQLDEYVYRNRQVLLVVAAGNSGRFGSHTVSEFAATKNALAVGNCGNNSTAPWYYGGSRMITENDMMVSSSRGTAGRMKPDVVAPGIHIMSARAGSRLEAALTGTSMAAPGVAGAAAAVVEMLGVASAPYPASLLRAILVASATPMRDGITIGPKPADEVLRLYDDAVGFGRINLSTLSDGVLTVLAAEDAGELREQETRVFTNVRTVRNRVTVVLAWTDLPGSELAPQVVVNHLQLSVDKRTAPPNDENTVQRLVLEHDELVANAPLAISVRCTSGVLPQDFSLVVLQQTVPLPPPPAPQTRSLTEDTSSASSKPNLFVLVGLPIAVFVLVMAIIVMFVLVVYSSPSSSSSSSSSSSCASSSSSSSNVESGSRRLKVV